MKTLTPGTIVDKKYNIEKQLGEGGMGVVWLARDINTEQPVVVKAIRAEYAHRKDFRDRILAEGRALARIDHANVVRLNSVVSDEDGLCLVMQFIEGETLEDRLERCKSTNSLLSVKEALSIFRQIVGAVAAAHAEGIIHRDLKPANVLIRKKDNVIKVTDFGIAKEEQAAQQGKGNTVGVIGSVKYLSPEQCTGHKDLDKRVDIYALGMLLFELLTGDPPFDGASHYEIMRLHVDAPIPSLSERRPDVPAWVDALVHRCAAKKREDRYHSCEEILDVLDAHGAGIVGSTDKAAPLPYQNAPSVARTSPAAPLMAQPQISQPQISQPQISQPQIVPMYNTMGTAPAASITRPDAEPGPRRGLMVALTVLLAAALGVAIAYTLGLFGPRKEHHPAGDMPVASTKPTPTTTTPEKKEPAAKNPLAALVGPWKSDSGREYDAVIVGEKLEMRIRDAKPFAVQGYEAGEARFVLSIVPGQAEVFGVEDRLRPNPPAGYVYDITAARLTCLFPYSELEGQPLQAKLEGGKLRVNMAFMKATHENFTLVGKRVKGCKNLATAAVEPIDSLLHKN